MMNAFSFSRRVRAAFAGLFAFCAVSAWAAAPGTFIFGVEGNVTLKNLFLAGTGEAVIDWGDGSSPQSIILKPAAEVTESDVFSHTYSAISKKRLP